MVVDASGRFVTQRTRPRLALVEVATDSVGLSLTAPGVAPLRVAVAELVAETGCARTRSVQVWRDEVEAVDCGEAAGAWFSDWLGEPASLVYMSDDVERAVNPKYGQPGDVVSFADGYPLLLASSSSLDDVNARLAEPVPMDRFRPNVVVRGSPAWAEDGWGRLRAGDVVLRVVKPCDRCTVPTIDQQTAARGVEPMRTLATFRTKGNDVLFAQNCIPDSLGEIAVGDRVTVLQ
jgi:uncharacterized protein YcbX